MIAYNETRRMWHENVVSRVKIFSHSRLMTIYTADTTRSWEIIHTNTEYVMLTLRWTTWAQHCSIATHISEISLTDRLTDYSSTSTFPTYPNFLPPFALQLTSAIYAADQLIKSPPLISCSIHSLELTDTSNRLRHRQTLLLFVSGTYTIGKSHNLQINTSDKQIYRNE